MSLHCSPNQRMRQSNLDSWKKKKNPFPKTSREKKTKTNPTPETLNPQPQEQHQEKSKEGKGFFACYLLTSLCPRFKGHTYIGFTVNPRRRIRQHNGEIGCGAFRTKKRRPWEMVICIYGFPTNVSALQFEWAWQHPTASVNVRQAAATFKTFSGVANKIKLAYTMLNVPAWKSLNITVNYFSTKYTNHSGGCPSLPENMKVQVCPMDELPCYTETDESFCEGEDGDNDRDDDENQNARDLSGNSEENLVSVQPSSMDAFLSYNGRGESSCEDGYSKHGKYDEEECSKDSNTGGTLEEMNRDADVHLSADYAHIFDKTYFHQSELFEGYYRVEQQDPKKLSDNKGRDRIDYNDGIVKERNEDGIIHTRADYAHNTVENSCARFGKFNESGRRDCSDPPTIGVCQPSGFINSPVRAASPKGTGISMRETGDVDVFTVIDDSSPEMSWQRQKKFRSKPVVDNNHAATQNFTAMDEIEVIDLLSPTPERRNGLGMNKRKASSVCPVVIDLT